NSNSPLSFHLTTSPVRYNLSPSPFGSGTNFSPVTSALFQYPLATPSPPVKSSPTTPTGTGRKWSSRTYAAVFAIGRPSATVSPTSAAFDRTWQQVKVVFSVGP